MNPDIKAQWLAALRSGEYEQTTGVLHDTEGYCCLGVLSDLAVKAGATYAQQSTAHGDGRYVYGLDTKDVQLPTEIAEWSDFDFEDVQLPPEVAEWADLDSRYPVVETYDAEDGFAHSDLAGLNDHGASFARIADLIEEQL